jgi:hypothetical protein
MSKISQLQDGGNPQAGDKILIARDGDNFWVNGGSIASTADLTLLRSRVQGAEDTLTLTNGSLTAVDQRVTDAANSITALQGINSATATRLTGIDSSVSAARGVADSALAKAIAATQLPISPILTKPGATVYFTLLPNYVLIDYNNITSFAFRSTNGYNGSFMFPFFCDRNVRVTSIKTFATISAGAAAKSYRFFIKNYDMANSMVLDYVYTGKQGNIASSATALKTTIIDNTMDGVLEAGKWYVVGMSLQGNPGGTADDLTCSGAYCYPATNGPYINAAGNLALINNAFFFAGTSHVTSGAPSNTSAILYGENRPATLSMDWTYTTASPKAFTGGSGFAA